MQNALTQTHLAAKNREERIELGFHIAVGVLLDGLRQALMELELELLTVEVSKPKVNSVTDRFGRTMFVPAMA